MGAEALLATYTLQLFGPKPTALWRGPIATTAVGIGPTLLRETEENLTDLLPEGYSVRIKEWDDEHD